MRRRQSPRFTRGFLIITPGITIKDRLRVLQPHDPDSYYQSRELIPADLMEEASNSRARLSFLKTRGTPVVPASR